MKKLLIKIGLPFKVIRIVLFPSLLSQLSDFKTTPDISLEKKTLLKASTRFNREKKRRCNGW
jgi:hypothetical protein